MTDARPRLLGGRTCRRRAADYSPGVTGRPPPASLAVDRPNDMLALARTLPMTAFTAPAGSTAEAELVVRCRRGDESAFAALVRLHERRVFRLAGRFFRHREDAEEVAQETFLRAWSKLG